MASAFTQEIQTDLADIATLLRTSSQDPPVTLVTPDLLSCLMLSWCEQRAQMLQSAAQEESWQAKVCDDVQEFLRSVFQLDVPLTIVDLPSKGSLNKGAVSYAELREMATQVGGLNRSLLIICGASGDREEEQWARGLGAWAYLPGVTDPSGLRTVFVEARKSLAKQFAVFQPPAFAEVRGSR